MPVDVSMWQPGKKMALYPHITMIDSRPKNKVDNINNVMQNWVSSNRYRLREKGNVATLM